MVEHIPFYEEDKESFRDRIATVDEKGKRKWVYAQKPKGRFYNWRTYLSWLYLALFFTLPYFEINGHPLFMFNFPKAKFILFGHVFWPQDFFIFAIGMITFVVFIVLFTAAFGRLFCGWVCPQTIFMEMVFRKIEYLIEGDSNKQKMLSRSPWNTNKILRRGGKHVVFYLLSFIIANYFLMYLIGFRELKQIITGPFSENVVGFFSIVVFSGVFYGVYAYFREQACTVVCPYGRLQSVLLDRNSMIVAYDYSRGEPRGKMHKNEERILGDCIDCHYCVRVCPTGIDIRNGTQLECVNCTACIDACDSVMEAIHKPKGLIRYASEDGIANKMKLRFTGRMKFYTVVLTVLVGVLSTLIITRKPVGATILRKPGMIYAEMGKDSIVNYYDIRAFNKTTQNIPITLKVDGLSAVIKVIGFNNFIPIKSEELAPPESIMVIAPKSAIHKGKTKITISLYNGDEKLNEMQTTFLGPVAEQNK